MELLARADWAAKAATPGSTRAPLVKLYTAEVLRQADTADGGPVRSFVITTGNPDRERDVVNPDGWELDNYRANPVVLFGHDYRSLPVGKCPDMRKDGGRWIADVAFPPAGVYAFADSVRGLVDFGALNAVSVGFDPLEWTYDEERGGYNFQRQELLEFSIVPVPANAEALMLSVKGLGARAVAPYKGWVLDAVKTLEAAGELPAPGKDAEPMQIPSDAHTLKVGEALDIHPWGKKAGCCAPEAPTPTDPPAPAADAAPAGAGDATPGKDAAPDVVIDLAALHKELVPEAEPQIEFTREALEEALREIVPAMTEHAVEARLRALTGRLD